MFISSIISRPIEVEFRGQSVALTDEAGEKTYVELESLIICGRHQHFHYHVVHDIHTFLNNCMDVQSEVNIASVH